MFTERNSLLCRLEKAVKKVSSDQSLKNGSGEVWFRGCLERHILLPNILRRETLISMTDLAKREEQLFVAFCQNMQRLGLTSHNIFLNHPMQEFDILATMQHYGLKTRLLDWTTSIVTALRFAINCIVDAKTQKLRIQSENQADWPVIWVLNPYKLNYMTGNRFTIYNFLDHPGYSYRNEILNLIRNNSPEQSWPHVKPLAICPEPLNERIRAQNGRFTFHGSDFADLAKQLSATPGIIKKVVIRPDEIGKLKQANEILNPRWYQISYNEYPDFEGFRNPLNQIAMRD